MTRLDKYILIRLRAGTPVESHDKCPAGTERHHLYKCVLYNRETPDLDALFNDNDISSLIDWWLSHRNFGLGIVPSHMAVDDAVTICGNPFISKKKSVLWVK